jgi:hypothetical protein
LGLYIKNKTVRNKTFGTPYQVICKYLSRSILEQAFGDKRGEKQSNKYKKISILV